jgi:tRNA (adenine22-N1)-methyltransferase
MEEGITAIRSGPSFGARLRAVGSLVPQGSRVADIGAGSGLLARWLLASGRVSACIATERDPVALYALERLAARLPALEPRSGDGLLALRPADDVDTVVLAGLGARSLLCILDRGRSAAPGLRRLVLQPQTEAGAVRRWLRRQGLVIVAERLVIERGRYYLALAAEARPGQAPHVTPPGLSEEDLLEAGPALIASRHPVVRRFWSDELARQEDILRRARGGPGRARAAGRRALARRVLAVLKPEQGAGPAEEGEPWGE